MVLPLKDLMDVKGLVNQALSKLVTTFFIEAQEQSDPQAPTLFLQLPEIEGLVRGGELDVEVVTILDLDSITSVRVDSTSMGGEACEAMGITFHEEQADPWTLIITFYAGSTPEPAGGGEGPSLPAHVYPSGETLILLLRRYEVVPCALRLSILNAHQRERLCQCQVL